MTNPKNLAILFFAILLSLNIRSQTDSSSIQSISIYGKKHIFTVETPQGWGNDKDIALNFGLFCFFYPETDSLIQLKSYIYVLGIDKLTPTENLGDFLEKDLKKFRSNNPDFTYIQTPVESSGAIIKSSLYTYSNLTERFKEKVLYHETDSAYIVLTFSTSDKNEYDKHKSTFDSFTSSFKFISKTPKTFLESKKITE